MLHFLWFPGWVLLVSCGLQAINLLSQSVKPQRNSARAPQGPGKRAPAFGRYEVVLEPFCLANMLEFLRDGFNARTVEEDRSFVKLGELQLDPAVTLWDDATDPRAVSRGFDAEGTPKRRVDLVREGGDWKVSYADWRAH